MEQYINKIINADCLDILKNLPDKCVDLVLTDPPYGITACDWDKCINWGLLWSELCRVCKKDVALIVTGVEPFASKIRIHGLNYYKYDLIWEKPQGTNPLLAKKRPMNNYENIMIFSTGKTPYSPIMEKGKPFNSYDNPNKKIGEVYGDRISRHNANCGVRYPKSIIKFSREKGFHPTQKPIKLFEYLIKTYSKENDLVLDCFSGSGTTAVACHNLKRRFICIERDPEYHALSVERLEQAQRQQTLF